MDDVRSFLTRVSAVAVGVIVAVGAPAPAGAGAPPPSTTTSTAATTTTASSQPVTPLASIAVAPADALRDLQAVQVTVSGYTPDAVVSLSQCALVDGGAGGVCHGATRGDVTADATGTAQTSFVVRRVVVEAGASVDCATAPGRCGIVASQSGQPTVSAALSFDASVPPAGPFLAVTPGSGLRDGDVVEVRGTGFTPGRAIKVAQCPAGTFAFEACDLSTQVAARSDGAGGFTVAFTVRAAIRSGGVEPDDVDCRTRQCVVTAADDVAASEHADAPISFASAEATGELPRTGSGPATAGTVVLALALVGLGAIAASGPGRAHRARDTRQ